MRHLTFTTTLCLAALAAAYSAVSMSAEPTMVTPATVARLTAGLRVASVERASHRIVGTSATPVRPLWISAAHEDRHLP